MSERSGRFDGRVAIVTGAASGLGRAVAQRLGAEGAAVACLDLMADKAEDTADAITNAGGTALALACDVSDERSVDAAVTKAVKELGPPAVACNVAGIGRFAHSHEQPVEEWQRIVGVNLTGTFLVCRATIPHMLEREGGSIVNVASTAGLMGQPYSAAYAASKGGVIMLTKALAIEYIRRGIRVNAIAPGGMETPMLETWGYPEGAHPKAFSKLTSPMGMCTPDEVAAMVVFVASDDARYMTGAVTVVDGGISA